MQYCVVFSSSGHWWVAILFLSKAYITHIELHNAWNCNRIMIHTTCCIKSTSILFAEKLLLILLCEIYVQSLCFQSDTQAVVIVLNTVHAMKLN